MLKTNNSVNNVIITLKEVFMTRKSTRYIKIAIIVSLNIIIVILSINLFKIDSVDALSKLGSNSEKVITDSAF